MEINKTQSLFQRHENIKMRTSFQTFLRKLNSALGRFSKKKIAIESFKLCYSLIVINSKFLKHDCRRFKIYQQPELFHQIVGEIKY